MPSTCECEARICSSSVEPERGRPTMKIGSGRAAPALRGRRRTARVQTAICRRVLRLDDFRPVPALGALQRVAALVVAEGLGIFAAGPRAPCRARSTGGSGRRGASTAPLSAARMRGDLGVAEAVGLEVRQAPVGIAEVRPAAPPPRDRRRSPPACRPRVFSACAIDRCRSASAGVPCSSSR